MSGPRADAKRANDLINLSGIRCLYRAVENCPHETCSLGRERLLAIMALAEEALLAREEEEASRKGAKAQGKEEA